MQQGTEHGGTWHLATRRASFDPAAVFRVCREKLDRNSVPDFIQVLDEIPKTASEKPQERFLVEAFEANPADVYSAADNG